MHAFRANLGLERQSFARHPIAAGFRGVLRFSTPLLFFPSLAPAMSAYSNPWGNDDAYGAIVDRHLKKMADAKPRFLPFLLAPCISFFFFLVQQQRAGA